jgi:hypothetical protein
VLYKTNRMLYNQAVRQGLSPAIELLECYENLERKVRTLYRCRVQGLSVLVQRGHILVNGKTFTPAELDNPDEVIRKANL